MGNRCRRWGIAGRTCAGGYTLGGLVSQAGGCATYSPRHHKKRTVRKPTLRRRKGRITVNESGLKEKGMGLDTGIDVH
jgi:hypothetical protein